MTPPAATPAPSWRDRAEGSWRDRAGSPFVTRKAPVSGSRGVVATNHPLGSAAGLEMLAAGGNAVDAAVAAFFALSVVEPMMVGPMGGGMAHVRTPDGRHVVLDGMSAAPLAATAAMFRPVSDAPDRRLEAEGRANQVGPLAVAAPGALRAWCLLLERHGTLPLDAVTEPAIRHAARGFAATPYLCDCVADNAADLAADPEMARVFLPGGRAVRPGERIVQGDTAETLRVVAREGAGALHGGAIGARAVEWLAARGGVLGMADLLGNAPVERQPVRGTYRGHEVVGPPAPSAGGMHVVQMLNILEGYDLARMGSGTADALHLVAEALRIAFADRDAATGDPAFLRVPAERLLSRDYAAERRALTDPGRTRDWVAGVEDGFVEGGFADGEGACTTHVSAADAGGTVVCMTQTINGLFGARVRVPGIGLIPNNYMANFDPHPGRAQSVAPGKRVATSMAPLIVLRDGAPRFALGLPGGLKIFGSAMQAVVNLVEHGMTLQEAVEAPRIWTQGGVLEVEGGVAEPVRAALAARGHDVRAVPAVGGGMNALRFDGAGGMEAASCWRADGTPMAMGGGLAAPGVRFVLDGAR